MDRIAWVAEKIKDHRRRPFGPPIRDTRLKKRAILKNGEYNILPPKFKRRYLYYIRDFFTGLVDAEWKWTLQVMAIGFVGCWIIFSLIWWLIAFVHKDLHDEHLPARQAETEWTPCVLNIHGWPSCFLFSLETQHTTGYGLRVITEECPEAIFIMCAQCIIGMIIDTFTVGVVVAKLMRPRLTHFTIQFSRNAVICLRDGELCLMYRVGDLRKSRLVGVSIGAILIHNRRTQEGEKLKYFESDLEVECDSTGSDLFFIWPVTIVHKINEDSPFYNLSATDMLQAKFEIVVTLDGTVESTGQGTNAKTSYLSNEILWGHRFEAMVTYNNKLECYEANYANFEKLVKIDMPTCSAADLAVTASEDDNKDEDKETISIGSTPKKTSLELPSKRGSSSEPHSAQTNDLKTFKEISATVEQRRQRDLSIEILPRSPNMIPSTRTRFDQTSVSETLLSPQSVSEYYQSRGYTDQERSTSRAQPRMEKSVLNRYEYLHSTQYETIYEGDERSDTPPFPISWV